MSPARSPLLSLAILVSLFSLVGAGARAQQPPKPKVLAPQTPVWPRLPLSKRGKLTPAEQVLTGGFWIIDANLKSSLYLRNDLKTDPLTVTPVLYLGNGNAYPLPPVILDPSGTATVDLNQALANQNIAPYASLSGYIELNYQWAWPTICAIVRNVDTTHSLIFTSGLQSQARTRIVYTQGLLGGRNGQQFHRHRNSRWHRKRRVQLLCVLCALTLVSSVLSLVCPSFHTNPQANPEFACQSYISMLRYPLNKSIEAALNFVIRTKPRGRNQLRTLLLFLKMPAF